MTLDASGNLGIGTTSPSYKLDVAGLVSSQDAYLITGLPASGKSGISNIISDNYGAIILDSDYAKRKIPEYSALPFGATLVHEESDRIIFGEANTSKFKSLFDYCRELNANIVIPKIGINYESLIELIILLKKNEYKVHLTLIELDRIKATKRALQRFKETDRYVPLGLIFDTYGNNPTIAFYKLITHNSDLLESYGIISTDVKKEDKAKCILKNNNLNPANLF
jgi:dephospho-CoA kinase